MAGTMALSELLGSEASWTASSAGRKAGEFGVARRQAVKEVMAGTYPARSGVALGGIGTGCAELRKDGRFYNWSIFGNKPMYTGPRIEFAEDSILFFMLRYETAGREPGIKVLQINKTADFAGQDAPLYYFPWMSCVAETEYRGRFPFVQMKFTDPEMPVEVELEAYSPFIPHDVKNSSLPVQIFNFRVTSTSKTPVDVMLMGTLRNCVGYDVKEKLYSTKLKESKAYKLCEMSCTGLDTAGSSFGTQALASLSGDTTYFLGWEHRHPALESMLRNKELANIDDTAKRTSYDRETGRQVALKRLFNTMGVSRKLKPAGSFGHTFVNTWHFPNLYAEKGRGQAGENVGHYYSRFFDAAAAVGDYVIENRRDLYSRTRGFVDDFYDSSAPGFVLDQINSQLNTFVTSAWLIKDGTFGIQEGLTASKSWGPVATTDVSYYGSIPVSALFADLQRNMLRAHRRQQGGNGAIVHGLRKGFTAELKGTAGVYHRLDLPGEYVTMVLREYFWSGDKAWLSDMWPSVKAALEYVLRERDYDGDGLPDMEGVMSSYDNLPMYGVASYIDSMWLAAMAYSAEAAKAIGDLEAEKKYRQILEQGTVKFEDKLWNGRYYRLWNDEGGRHGGKDEGCFTDQIIGQWAAHLCSLGEIHKAGHKHKALKSIMEMSYRQGFGLRNCSWPGDKWWHDIPDDMWVDQLNTCWSGVELEFAALLIYEGMYEEGLKVIATVEQRYRRAGLYWDHQEFGGHYYRPMSAFSIVNAMLGLGINAGTYSFSPKLKASELKLFFTFDGGTAHYIRKVSGGSEAIEIDVKTGRFTAKKLVLSTVKYAVNKVEVSVDGRKVSLPGSAVKLGENRIAIEFKSPLTVNAGGRVQIDIA